MGIVMVRSDVAGFHLVGGGGNLTIEHHGIPPKVRVRGKKKREERDPFSPNKISKQYHFQYMYLQVDGYLILKTQSWKS